ncbi:MAG TPA: sigma-70 family RNA polymerase sigma factor [Ramlibacter sp.]|uniref:sigma-70 family RNA polymerase sigma factor n=1 Tax=Ramlibacter sp. TaxID=1917967 RepID=UPI002CE158EC|nr:sigma-70 family RNA polymerase sigma factor [Ramlibacter sp.]HVZ46111.1 sigma-70 family RNA polymerase sigma factor [Ramlibacter sp.]
MLALDIRPDDAPPRPAAADDEEAALWQLWRGQRDVEARNRLLGMHLPHARLIAAKYFGRRFNDSVDFDDYLQLARMALIEAMDRFDPDAGVPFRAFADRRMHGAIVDGLERATEKQQQIAAYQRLQAQRAESIRGEGEGDAKPATAAQRTTDQVLQYVAQAGLAFALSWLLDGTRMVEQKEEPVESIPFYRGVELRELRARVLELVATLTTQQRIVIQRHYLQEQSFESIAAHLEVSRSRVSQVHREALARLREALRDRMSCDVLA